MSLLIAGTVALDNITTPTQSASNLLGGSASYAALAASRFHQEVQLIGIIGKDFPQEHLTLLQSNNIDTSGIEHTDGNSFTWTGEYHDNFNQRTTHAVALNVLENWQPIVPQVAQSAEFICLANMSPDNQFAVLEQCTAPHKFVAADTMDLWIQISQERLKQLLPKLDLFVLNEGEAKELAQTNNVIAAGKQIQAMGPQFVIIKLGEYGAILFGKKEETSANKKSETTSSLSPIFRCSAWPLEQVADPTGAGDSFLGALLGTLAASNNRTPSFADISQAIVTGTIAASFTCEAFSTIALESADQQTFTQRKAEFATMCHFS